MGLGCALGLAGLWAPAATAQDGGAAAAKLERLTLDIKDQPLVDVVKYVRSLTGADIRIGEGPHQTRLIDAKPPAVVTVKFEAVPWRSALAVIAKSADCRVRRTGDRYTLYRPTLVTLEFERADLRDVVYAIAKQSGGNVIIGSDVPDGLPVSVRLRGIPWYQALTAVVKSVGMTVVRSEGGTMRIVEPGTVAHRAALKAAADQAEAAKLRRELQQRRKQLEQQLALLEQQVSELRKKLADLTARLREKK